MCKSCGKPTGAGWWRVSGDSQRELSPETQVKHLNELAEQKGYHIPAEYILGTDWASLEVWNSPPMERLKTVIENRAGEGLYGPIEAVFMDHPDRSPSDPVQRLMFRALCEEHGVKILAASGQIPEGETAQFLDFADAWAKEKQVRKAQRGAKNGLRDRAMLKRLPPTCHPPYGYKFQYKPISPTVRIPVALEPDPATYPLVCRIWRMALDGMALRRIALALLKDGIAAPMGGAAWSIQTLSDILHNPAYGGLYCTLREEAVAPKVRKGDTYGKSSSRKRKREDWVPLPDFPVIDPPVSMQEYELVVTRLPKNKQESPRNAKRFYMLGRFGGRPGLLICAECGRRLEALTTNRPPGHYVYRCKARAGQLLGSPRCACPYLNGPKTEEDIWTQFMHLVTHPEEFMNRVDQRRGTSDGDEPRLRRQLQALERRLKKIDAMDTELFAMRVRYSGKEGQLKMTDEVFERNLALNNAERSYVSEEIERQRATLAAIEESKAAMQSLRAMIDAMREEGAGALEETTPEQRRRWLEEFGTRISVHPDRELEMNIRVPERMIKLFLSSVPGYAGQKGSYGFSFALTL